MAGKDFLGSEWETLIMNPPTLGFNPHIVEQTMASFHHIVGAQTSTTEDHGVENEKSIKKKKRKSPQFEKTQFPRESEQCNDPEKEAAREKDDKSAGNADEEDYIHVRAKRGQATNSHSLAERVRRERINERMRLLQNLVPGCNKITGKAMMLDEIINYVQSLQRQVEFLSMKLAAVSPDLSFDIEHILSRDVRGDAFNCREGNCAIVGFDSQMIKSNPSFHGLSLQQEMLVCSIPNHGGFRAPAPHISSMAQVSDIWCYEMQSPVQMNFTNAPLHSKEMAGFMKVEGKE